MATISLCMIVKNEEAVLERVLEQMKDIADEIIIADTGSDDRTKEIAAKYTTLIYDYPWQQDFAAARNFACSKAKMDYWLWLDADDVVTPENQRLLLELKNTLQPSVDVVMMKYEMGFDENGQAGFSYYRERLLKNRAGFFWEGRVHEAVTPSGNILYSPIAIQHRKAKAGDPDRNLRIYEEMLKDMETKAENISKSKKEPVFTQLAPRHQFYYGRELYFHKKYEQAAAVFSAFLDSPEGWVENKIDACLHLSRCYEGLNRFPEALKALFSSFVYSLPRGEICYEAGQLYFSRQLYAEAIYWYKQALEAKPPQNSGAFIHEMCYNFLPCLQLCVCFDKIGDYEKAFFYHQKSMAMKPSHPSVLYNEAYFKGKSAQNPPIHQTGPTPI